MSITIAFVDDSELMRTQFDGAVDVLNHIGFDIELEMFTTKSEALANIAEPNQPKPDVFFVDYNIWEKHENEQYPRNEIGTSVIKAAQAAEISTIGFSGRIREWDTISSLKHPDDMILSITLALKELKEQNMLSDEASTAIPEFTQGIYDKIGVHVTTTTAELRREGGKLHGENLDKLLNVTVQVIDDNGEPTSQTRQTKEASIHPWRDLAKIEKLGIPKEEIEQFFPEDGKDSGVNLAGLISYIAQNHSGVIIKPSSVSKATNLTEAKGQGSSPTILRSVE